MKNKIFLAAALAAVLISACAEKKVYLFNGENLDGWKTVLRDDPDAITGASTFSVKDGVIHITGQPFGYIRTEKALSNYKLHLEWRWAGEESADGGIFNFLQGADKVWPLGVQFQMTSKDMGALMGGIPIEGVEGPSFYRKNRLVEESPEKPLGEWNDVDFECKDGNIKVWLNGVLVNEANCQASEGFIGIQSEGGPIEFRNIYYLK
jgi:hypothetical protein